MTFWKPGTVAPGSEVERGEEGFVAVYNPFEKEFLSIQEQKLRLPIYNNKKEIYYLLEQFQVVIIVGQTGCGKTTQIPQYLYEIGYATGGRTIACTQPRRIAATTVATRVAEEMQVNLGEEVGYTIRFEDKSDQVKTRIKYLTDGMLFREMFLDPLLTKYSVIMVDEAHERTLYTDIVLGLLKKILKKRPELRVIISSATLDAEQFYDFFSNMGRGGRTEGNDFSEEKKENVYIMSIPGRMYPVDIHYLEEPCSNFKNTMVETIFNIHDFEKEGDVLAFLTGREEIEEVSSMLKEKATVGYGGLEMMILPLYSGLTLENQMKVFEPSPRGYRKIILCTNIAEASVTIEGIAYVVDCGFVKIRAYQPNSGMESLIVVPCSKASALQRAGRAGRMRPGKTYRLYTEEAFNSLPDNGIPELQRSNLSTVLLQLKAIGVENVLRFDFVSPPPAKLMSRALELLYALGCLDDYTRLTIPMGIQVAEFPVDPMLAKILLVSPKYECTEEILIISSLITVENIFIFPNKQRRESEESHTKFAVQEGDHLTLLNVFMSFIKNRQTTKWCSQHFLNWHALQKALTVRQHLLQYLKRFLGKDFKPASCMKNKPPETLQNASINIRKCIVSGYFSQAGKLQMDGSYKTIRDNATIYIHPNSVLFRRVPEWVIFHEVVETTKVFMREVTVIQPEWLGELASHFYEIKEKRIQL